MLAGAVFIVDAVVGCIVVLLHAIILSWNVVNMAVMYSLLHTVAITEYRVNV